MASDVSEHQLDALSGSRALHIEVFLQGQFRPSPRALASGTRRLLAALQREQVPGTWGLVEIDYGKGGRALLIFEH